MPEAIDILEAADDHSVYHGVIQELPDDAPRGTFCAFWSGPVGLYVIAQSMTVWSHHGPIPFDAIQPMAHQWWKYWREYWDKKHTDKALPKDYACEATIPLADGP